MNNDNRDDSELGSDRLEFEGIVIEASNNRFRVQITEHHIALCTLSGKVRMNSVKILLGDAVRVEVSPYEITKGRIIYRHKS